MLERMTENVNFCLSLLVGPANRVSSSTQEAEIPPPPMLYQISHIPGAPRHRVKTGLTDLQIVAERSITRNPRATG